MYIDFRVFFCKWKKLKNRGQRGRCWGTRRYLTLLLLHVCHWPLQSIVCLYTFRILMSVSLACFNEQYTAVKGWVVSEPGLQSSDVHVNQNKPSENNYIYTDPLSPLRLMDKGKARPGSPVPALCVHVIHQFRRLTVSAISTTYIN